MKNRRLILPFLALCELLFGVPAQLHSADRKPSLFLTLFRLTVGEDSKIQEFQVEKVMDLFSGSNHPVSMELPQTFIEKARRSIESEPLQPRMRDGKPISTFTTFLYVPTEEGKALSSISFAALDGAMSSTHDFQLLGQEGAVSIFGANEGRFASFISFYALPSLPKTLKEQREAIVEAEVQRSSANVQGAEILSRKNLSTDSETIMEFTCRTPLNPALTIRSRYICNAQRMLALSAVTPDDGLSVEEAQAFDRLFQAFQFQ